MGTQEYSALDLLDAVELHLQEVSDLKRYFYYFFQNHGVCNLPEKINTTCRKHQDELDKQAAELSLNNLDFCYKFSSRIYSKIQEITESEKVPLSFKVLLNKAARYRNFLNIYNPNHLFNFLLNLDVGEVFKDDLADKIQAEICEYSDDTFLVMQAYDQYSDSLIYAYLNMKKEVYGEHTKFTNAKINAFLTAIVSNAELFNNKVVNDILPRSPKLHDDYKLYLQPILNKPAAISPLPEAI